MKGVGKALACSHGPAGQWMVPPQLALLPLPLRAWRMAAVTCHHWVSRSAVLLNPLLLLSILCCSLSTLCCSLSTLRTPAASYGDRAAEITRIAEQRKLGKRIVRGYPILEAEVVYAGRWPPLAWGMRAGR